MRPDLPAWFADVPMSAFHEPADDLPAWLARHCAGLRVIGSDLRDISFDARWRDVKARINTSPFPVPPRLTYQAQPLVIVRSEQEWGAVAYLGNRADEWQQTFWWDRVSTLLRSMFDDSLLWSASADMAAFATALADEVQPLTYAAQTTSGALAALALLLRSIPDADAAAVRTLLGLSHSPVMALLEQHEHYRANLPLLDDVMVQVDAAMREVIKGSWLMDVPDEQEWPLRLLCAPQDAWPDLIDEWVAEVDEGMRNGVYPAF